MVIYNYTSKFSGDIERKIICCKKKTPMPDGKDKLCFEVKPVKEEIFELPLSFVKQYFRPKDVNGEEVYIRTDEGESSTTETITGVDKSKRPPEVTVGGKIVPISHVVFAMQPSLVLVLRDKEDIHFHIAYENTSGQDRINRALDHLQTTTWKGTNLADPSQNWDNLNEYINKNNKEIETSIHLDSISGEQCELKVEYKPKDKSKPYFRFFETLDTCPTPPTQTTSLWDFLELDKFKEETYSVYVDTADKNEDVNAVQELFHSPHALQKHAVQAAITAQRSDLQAQQLSIGVNHGALISSDDQEK